MRLSELAPFSAGRVVRVLECPARLRLESMGVSAGAEITRLFGSVFGDPSAYSVNSAVIGIRRSDAERIIVETVGKTEEVKSGWE